MRVLFDNSLISARTHAPVMIFLVHIRINAGQFVNGGHLLITELSVIALPAARLLKTVSFIVPTTKETGALSKNCALWRALLLGHRPEPLYCIPLEKFPVTSWTLSESAWRSRPGCCRCCPGRRSRTTSPVSRSPAGTRTPRSSGTGRRS